MMKTILKLALLFTIVGCSEPEQERTPDANCNCSTIKAATTYTIPGRVWTVATVTNDCNGLQSQIELNGVRRIGEKICN
jgi:hypothetical protein